MARSQPITYRGSESGVYVSKTLIAAIAVAGALALGWLGHDFFGDIPSAVSASPQSSELGAPVSSALGAAPHDPGLPVSSVLGATPDDQPLPTSEEPVAPSTSQLPLSSPTTTSAGGTSNVYMTIVNAPGGTTPAVTTASPTGAAAQTNMVQRASYRVPTGPGRASPGPGSQIAPASASGYGATRGPVIVGGRAVMVPGSRGAPASGGHANGPAQVVNLQLPSGMAATAIGEHIVIAYDGSIVYVGDNGSLTGNTGDASTGGTVALDAQGSTFSSRYSSTVTGGSAVPGTALVGGFNPLAIPHDASPLVSAFISYTGGRTADIAGYEDHSVLTRGMGNVVTYDDSNVFINRDGKINSNTGDTDSAGLNAIATLRSIVSAGPHCDDGCDDESIIQAQAGVFDEGDVAVDGDGHVVWSPDIAPETEAASVNCDDPAETNDDGCDDSLPGDNGDDSDAADDESADGDVSDPAEPAETREEADSTRPAADNGEEPDGEFPTGSLIVGGDGIDDLSLRVDGVGNVSTYDDGNVVIGGTGDVNSQIGDSDTGGTVTMDTVDSVVSGGNSR
jgi:hypothetical protein